jgi:hypothetical protein
MGDMISQSALTLYPLNQLSHIKAAFIRYIDILEKGQKHATLLLMPQFGHQERSLMAFQAQHLTNRLLQDCVNQSELVNDHTEARVVIASDW